MPVVKDLSSYIKAWRSRSSRFNNFMDQTIRDLKGYYILGPLKRRLYSRGVDATGSKIGDYSPFTKRIRNKLGLVTSHVQLFYTGDWYDSMFVTVEKGVVTVDSTDKSKTEKIEEKYGKEILQMSDEEVNKLIDTRLEPEIQKWLDKNPNLKISFKISS